MSAEDAVADLLTLKSLRTLAAVARAGSLTRAASELGLAQSAVSRQLGELERALGGPLFHRTGRGMQPSDLGEQVLPSVQSLLAQAGELARAGRERAGTPSGVVTLGMVPGVAGFLAPALYGEVNRACPQVRLRVLEGYSGDMETALTQGRIEMAVLNRYRARGANSYRRLFEAQVCLVFALALGAAQGEPLPGHQDQKIGDGDVEDVFGPPVQRFHKLLDSHDVLTVSILSIVYHLPLDPARQSV